MEYYVKLLIAAVLILALAGCAATGDMNTAIGEDAEADSGAVLSLPGMAPGELTEIPVEEREPTDPEVMFQVLAGELSGAKGDVTQALENYLEATLKSNDPAIAERSTELGMRGGNWQLATMAADRWTVLDPDNPSAQAAAITTLLRVNDYFGATRHLDELFRIRADKPGGAWEEAALLLGTYASGEKAKEIMRDLLARHGVTDNAEAKMAQSRLAMTLGEPELAAELADEALELEPENVELLMWAGRLAVIRNDSALGISYFERAHAAGARCGTPSSLRPTPATNRRSPPPSSVSLILIR